MNLHIAACEWMKLSIATTPTTAPTDWEASVDDGATWETATDVDNFSAWLVAGPDYVPGPSSTFTVAAGRTPVLVRLIANPETVVDIAPDIKTFARFQGV